MKRLICLLLFFPLIISAQTSIEEAVLFNGEAHIAVAKSDVTDLKALEAVMNIDEHHFDETHYYGVVVLPKVQEFVDFGIEFELLEHPNKSINEKAVTKADYSLAKSTDCSSFLSGYPSYDLYEQMMADYAAEYPEICRYEEFGVLPSGRKLMALVISDNPNTVEDEPRFLYTSTMHGDETAGYILSLRLIKDILCNYPSDPRIANLVDNIEIWINPLANPDGTYAWGNNNLNGARRSNSNFVDLNRNYEDPQFGDNPDGNSYQPETQAFMTLAENVHFDMSSNMHGGVEVANYPWDTWSFEHADDDWWVHVTREYADTAQANSPNGYFDYLNNGITNGYDWYPVAGGRQDYQTYFHHGREMTLELTNTKFMPSSQFNSRWNYNRDALYNYMEQSLYGLRGIVTDASTGQPIAANVNIASHDMDNSDVFSRLPNGNYHRYLFEGSYDVTYSADGYESQTITISVANNQTTFQNVALSPSGSCDVTAGSISTQSQVGGICAGDNEADIIEVDLTGGSGYAGVFGIVDQSNNVMGSSQNGTFNVNNLPTGTYRIKHMYYAQGVNPAVSNASELTGCYALSNSLFFTVNRVEGGAISTSDPTVVCGDDGQTSTLSFDLAGEEGSNSRWVALNSSFTEVISSSSQPNWNFDSFGSGVYRVVHVSYANGVNLSQVDPQNIEGCLDVSNTITVTVNSCGSSLTEYVPGSTASVLFTPERTGDYQVELMDVNGRILDRIYAGEGYEHQSMRLSWDTQDLATGVYLIKASCTDYSETKKIMIE
ncbi:MAG: M14 family zinc carboxypeptidase [Bacteroidota bacterium]